MYKLAVFLVVSYAHVADSALRGGGAKSSSLPANEQHDRILLDAKTVSGECTVENFASYVGGKSTLASYLSSTNDDAAMQAILDTKCANALDPQM